MDEQDETADETRPLPWVLTHNASAEQLEILRHANWPDVLFVAKHPEMLDWWRDTPEFLQYHLDGILRADTGLEELCRFTASDLNGASLLDVACGYGGLIIAAGRRGATASGVDIDRARIKGAAERLDAWGLKGYPIYGSVFGLPFQHCSFDVVTCDDVFDHVDWKSALVEISRVLKPAGYLWARTCTMMAYIGRDPHIGLFGISLLPNRLAALYLKYIRRRIARCSDYDCKFPTRWGLRRAVRDCGLSLQQEISLSHMAYRPANSESPQPPASGSQRSCTLLSWLRSLKQKLQEEFERDYSLIARKADDDSPDAPERAGTKDVHLSRSASSPLA